MDRPSFPLFRPAAVEAASGTQIGASLATHWRGVTVFTAVAFVLLAALIAFVVLVEHAPMHRLAAFVAARDTTKAGPPLATIAQEDSIVVRLLVPPAAVASVRPGAALKLAFRAYPQERFGLFGTTIESVDDIASLPTRVPLAVEGGSAPIVVATASLPDALRGPQGEALPLKPGMLAEALVPGERRPIVAWLLEPILGGRDDGVGHAGPVGEARR